MCLLEPNPPPGIWESRGFPDAPKVLKPLLSAAVVKSVARQNVGCACGFAERFVERGVEEALTAASIVPGAEPLDVRRQSSSQTGRVPARATFYCTRLYEK